MKKRNFVFILAIAILFVLSACAGDKEEADSELANDDENVVQTVLKAVHALPKDHPYEKALQEMGKNIEVRTNGRVKIETSPNSGEEHQLFEQLTRGSVDIVVASTASMANVIPELRVLDLPFLFNDRESAINVLEGEIGQELFEKIEVQGVIPLSWGENGLHHITSNSHPILLPKDLEGVKIFSQENEFIIQALNVLGAEPIEMTWDEAIQALKREELDAQENSILVADKYDVYDAGQNYLSLTGHMYAVSIFMMSQHTYDKLPEDVCHIIVEEGQKIGAFERELFLELEQEALKLLESEGMEIAEGINAEPFREAIQSVYEGYPDQELLNKIREAQSGT